MPTSRKTGLIFRCPVCFARENDVVLLRDKDNSYYCIKCSFHGNESEIYEMYSDLQKKYKNITKRLNVEEISNL